MSNGSLKEQLCAVASQFSDPNKKDKPAPQRQAAPQQAKQHRAQQHKPRQAERPAQKPKPRWLEYAQYGVDLLKVYFPGGFKGMADVKPLKIGIKEDLLKKLSTLENVVTEDKACMVKSLSYYVNTQVYHKSMFEGAVRVDLDGQPAGVVTAEEAKYSVEKQQARLQAKKAPVTATPAVKNPEEALEPA
jgi:ProP effector